MSWEPLDLERSWDLRWDANEARDAVLRADEQVLKAKANLEHAISCVRHATEQYAIAVSWMGTIRTFERPHLPTIAEPPALGDQQVPEAGL